MNVTFFYRINHLVLNDIAIQYNAILNRITDRNLEEKGVSLVRPMQYSVQQ